MKKFYYFGMTREKGVKMKIEVLRLIEEALIGGRNGEMAFIENNPLIATLYREFANNSKDRSFKAFLLDCINDEAEQYSNNNFKTTEIIIKKTQINKHSEEYKEYKKQLEILNSQQRKVNEALNKLAISTNETLTSLTNDYEISYGEYDTFMKYSIIAKIIKEME